MINKKNEHTLDKNEENPRRNLKIVRVKTGGKKTTGIQNVRVYCKIPDHFVRCTVAEKITLIEEVK